MYRASVNSRFPDYGKLILLSFPRYKKDFIQQRYDDVVAEKETVVKTHRFKLDPDLPDGSEKNEFNIDWEEDHILSYAVPKVFALKRPTWDVNPTRTIDDFAVDFYTDPVDALSRFACMPPEAVDAFFRSREKIERAFRNYNIAVDEDGRFAEWFQPQEDKLYFVHVDLAQKHDHCAVSMAHVENWVNIKIGNQTKEAAPSIVVDAVRWWTPTSTQTVDFTEVKDYIISLKHRGFNVGMVTFDRWNSFDMMQQLKAYGMNAEVLSVAKKHYEDMALAIMEERVDGPNIKLLIDELLSLRIVKDKIDHPRKGSKDLSDATCGAIYNAVSRTPADLNQEVLIKTYDYEDLDLQRWEQEKKDRGVIQFPEKREMPNILQEFMDSFREDDGQEFVDNFTIL